MKTFLYFIASTLALSAQTAGPAINCRTATTTCTTTGINTSAGSSNLGVLMQLASTNVTPTDSLSNTWTSLTAQVNNSTGAGHYSIGMTTGASQTFSITGLSNFNALCAASFSGVNTFVSQVGSDMGGVNGLTAATGGSITPTTGDLIVSLLMLEDPATALAIDSGFTIATHIEAPGGSFGGCAIAYKVAVSASAQNPSWSWTTSGRATVTNAIFRQVGVLAPGVISKTGNSGLTTMSLSTTAASGGTAPYSYQWQRSAFGAGSWSNICTNSTSCADSGLSTGTNYDYRVVVTDNASATANSATFTGITLFPVTDSHIGMTPGNWYTSGSSWAATNRGGSEFRFGFTGTSAILVLDMTNVSSPTSIGIASVVDNAARVAGNPAASVTLASGLSAGTHSAHFWDAVHDSSANCWTVNGTAPDYVVRIIGIQLDAGASMATAPTVPTAKMIFFGDSITAGAAVGSTVGGIGGDFLYAYPINVAAALNSEPSYSAFSSSGWNVTAGGSNVPVFASAYGNYWNGQARTLTGVYSRAIINLGRNDSGSIGSTIAADVALVRTALGVSTKLFVIVPFAQTVAAAMATGMASYCGTLSGAVTVAGTRTYKTCANDSATYFVDFGTDGSLGLAGSASYQSSDGTHPNYYGQNVLAGYLVGAIKAIEGGGGSGPGPIVAQ
jgi:hypothetical protein